jgi:aminomethyltransferase
MKTALYEKHIALHAKMVSFAGWEMPMQYQGIIIEHIAVRNHVGLFDVSHMGFIEVLGKDAEHFLDFLSTNRIEGKSNGSATYTVWCHANGGSVDDLIVFRVNQEHFFVVANASNREKDLSHMCAIAATHSYNVNIKASFQDFGILALQGPQAIPLLTSLLPETAALKPMHFLYNEKNTFYVARTGYTGSDGFEIMGPSHSIVKWWDLLLKEGQPYGILPVGLGARDTLRLEMGFALYGHELSDTIAPIESVSAWTVKWDHLFCGKEALLQWEKNPKKRFSYGIRMIDNGIPRQGCEIFLEDERIGEVTSGSFSPTLEKGIALILTNCPLTTGQILSVQIRQHRIKAQVEQLRFIRKST